MILQYLIPKTFGLTKEILENDYKELKSKYQVKLKYGISLHVIQRWFKEFGIETTYYKKIDKVKMKELCISGEPVIYAADQLGCPIHYYTTERNRLGWVSEPKLFDFETTKKLCEEIVGIYSQGIDKAFLADPNLRHSVEHYTKDHFLESDKFTERVYRIIHNYKPDQKDKCKVTDEPLKFYTIVKGYGESELKISKRGSLYCKSAVSQKMFNEIHKKLPKKLQKKCKFSSLNKEGQVKINKKDQKLPGMNKFHYQLDFCLDKHNIEFDGTYWHSNRKNQDSTRDKYLQGKGYKILRITESEYNKYPKITVQKCLQFLKDSNKITAATKS
jgi:very-short-patch-repair endonuclease